MHKVRTPWPVATRVSFIVSFEELRRRHPRLSARRLSSGALTGSWAGEYAASTLICGRQASSAAA